MKHSILTALVLILFSSCQPAKKEYQSNTGLIFGTYYHTTYQHPDGVDLQESIEAELQRLDLSLSTYKASSVLSKINNNESSEPDKLVLDVFQRAVEISELTGGAFDATVAPLVNAWGFGFTKKVGISEQLIDSIMDFVGWPKVRLDQGIIVKDDPRSMLDFSAIAKGYAVDMIGRLLSTKGCENYMVDIGGEVIACGLNPDGKSWRIGINEPNDNEPAVPDQLQAIVHLSNKAIATSGNYRNFYVEDGKKYAHTIDPSTGYPVQHSLLSATVIADDCMTADALATACMVMGTEKAMELSTQLSKVELFLIYNDGEGENKVIMTPGFESYIEEK